MAAAISVVVLVSTASSYLESELDQSSINRAKKQQQTTTNNKKQQQTTTTNNNKQQQTTTNNNNKARTLAGLPSTRPPRRRVCAGKNS
jgi:F0F1-type ATP synthase epsilon subunit